MGTTHTEPQESYIGVRMRINNNNTHVVPKACDIFLLFNCNKTLFTPRDDVGEGRTVLR